MTGRLIIAIALILSSLLLRIVSQAYIEREIVKFVEIIDSGISVTQKSASLSLLWSKNKTIFSVFLKHADADILDKCLSELESACEAENEELSVEILGELKANLSVASDGEKLRVENIF